MKTLLIVALVILLPLPLFAATLDNPLGTSDLRVIIGRIIQSMLGLSGMIALVAFIWGGFQWMLSGGDPGKIKKGKDTIIWAVFGLVLIFVSYSLVATVIATLTAGTT